MPPPPPTSTLFPYTTLFRSHDREPQPDRRGDDHAEDDAFAEGTVNSGHGEKLTRRPMRRCSLTPQAERARVGRGAATRPREEKPTIQQIGRASCRGRVERSACAVR